MEIKTSEVIGSLDAGLGGMRLAVVLSEGDGPARLALQLSSWSEALGWQVQKTLPLAADKLGQLQRLLSQARQRIDERREPPPARARVIPLTARRPDLPALSAAAQPAWQLENLAS